MKELSFILSLKNKLSGPLGKAGKSVDSFANNSLSALKRLGGGFAGLWATTKSLTSVLKPASDIQSALDELSTRNVGSDVLEKLRRQAGEFSTAYGIAAEDFIGSVTTIRSAIRGLSDNDIPRVAQAVNTLAVATKSSGTDAADYIGELASVFVREADRMGHAAFAENFASKTAWLVKNTGQDMAKIRALLQGSKGIGVNYGVSADEQLAVLGELGASLGSGAGGAYEAFLKNARVGAKELGLSFVDAQGALLSFPDILDKLQDKYGDSVTGNIRLQEKLNKVFGAGANAVIKTWGSSEKLRKSIRELQGAQGLGGAAEMAAKMSDLWARLGQGGARIRNAFGAALLPVFEPLINKVITLTARLARWLEMFPNITRHLGYFALLVTAVTALVSILAMLAGVKMVFAVLGLKKAFAFLNLSLLPTRVGLMLLAVQSKAFALWAGICRLAVLAWNGVLGVASLAMRAYGLATMFAGVAMQFLMSPVTLVILAIAALVAGVWYAVTHWETLKAAVMDTAAFRLVSVAFEWVAEVVRDVWSRITAGWDAVVNFFATHSPLMVFNQMASAITDVFSGLWRYLETSFSKTYNWIVSKLNAIPGVSIDLKGVTSDPVDTPKPQQLSAPAGVTPARTERGGLLRSIMTNTTSSSQTDKGTHVDQVNIYPQNQESFSSLMESRELAAP